MAIYAAQISIDPTTVNEVSPFHGNPGDVYAYKHATHGWWLLRYGQFKDAVTYAANQVLTLADAQREAFTNDVSGGSSLGLIPAGVCLLVMTQDYYGFALIDGRYPTVKTNGDDDIGAGNGIIVANADGQCDSGTTTATFMGRALAADVDADNTVDVMVEIH